MRSNTEGGAPSHAWPKAEELEPEDIDSSTDFQGMPWYFSSWAPAMECPLLLIDQQCQTYFPDQSGLQLLGKGRRRKTVKCGFARK